MQTVQSEKNGKIRVQRMWGGGLEVWAGGTDQTSRYTNAMWRMSLSRIPKDAHVKRVLLVGLGGGGILPILLKKFPSCRITVIEYDPIMADLAKTHMRSSVSARTEILLGDASTLVPSLARTYDAIVLDVSSGKKVSPVAAEPSFASALRDRLQPHGYFLANFICEPEISSVYENVLSLERPLRYYYNYLRLYRPHGAGVVGSRLPEGYVPYRMCRPYMEREAANQKNTVIVGTDACPGYRTRYGRFSIDKFFGDALPKEEGGRRLIVWRPFVRNDHPAGWLKGDLLGNIGLTGIAKIEDEYWKPWDQHAQRHRARWRGSRDWALEEVGLEEFLNAYMKTKKGFMMKELFSAMLKRKVRGHGSRVRLIGARRRESTEIHAGFASLTIPESRQAVHLISFIHDAARASSVGVGMMDDWFSFGHKNGLRFLDFGLFWRRGEPKSWKPWSNFKAQFGMHYIMHPSPLAKIVWKNERGS